MEDEGLRIAFAGDMNAGRRSRGERALAKLTGLTAGEPDVRIYLPSGRLLSVELKTGTGSRSKAQKERHALLADLGFEVVTIAAEAPEAAADAVERLIRDRLKET